ALPDPGRRAGRIVPRCGERLVERVTREVDRYEANVARRLSERPDARALLALRVRVIDLEDGGLGELAHAPGATVEARAEDHQLRRPRFAHRLVDRDRAGGHDLRLDAGERVADRAADPLALLPREEMLDVEPRVLGQEREGRRVGELFRRR